MKLTWNTRAGRAVLAVAVLLIVSSSGSAQRPKAEAAAPTAAGKVVVYEVDQSITVEMKQRGGQTKKLAFAIVKYVGAAYLIYVGVRRLLSRGEPPVGDLHLPRRSLWRLYADGFVVNLLNPKTALFFLAFLPQWISPAKGAEPFQLAFLGLLFAVMGLLTDGAYALLAGTAGGWLKRSRGFLKAERYVTGGIFVGLGVTAAMAGDGRNK